MLILLYSRHDKLDDLGLHDIDPWLNVETYESAAKQLLAQLEGQWCPAFLMALRDEINRELDRWEKDKSTPTKEPA